MYAQAEEAAMARLIDERMEAERMERELDVQKRRLHEEQEMERRLLEEEEGRIQKELQEKEDEERKLQEEEHQRILRVSNEISLGQLVSQKFHQYLIVLDIVLLTQQPYSSISMHVCIMQL